MHSIVVAVEAAVQPTPARHYHRPMNRPLIGLTGSRMHGRDLVRKWLDAYEAPALDPSIDEALNDFIRRKKDSMPDAFA